MGTRILSMIKAPAPLITRTREEATYLYINVRKNVKVADLVRQLESLAEARITDTAFWR